MEWLEESNFWGQPTKGHRSMHNLHQAFSCWSIQISRKYSSSECRVLATMSTTLCFSETNNDWNWTLQFRESLWATNCKSILQQLPYNFKPIGDPLFFNQVVCPSTRCYITIQVGLIFGIVLLPISSFVPFIDIHTSSCRVMAPFVCSIQHVFDSPCNFVKVGRKVCKLNGTKVRS